MNRVFLTQSGIFLPPFSFFRLHIVVLQTARRYLQRRNGAGAPWRRENDESENACLHPGSPNKQPFTGILPGFSFRSRLPADTTEAPEVLDPKLLSRLGKQMHRLQAAKQEKKVGLVISTVTHPCLPPVCQTADGGSWEPRRSEPAGFLQA